MHRRFCITASNQKCFSALTAVVETEVITYNGTQIETASIQTITSAAGLTKLFSTLSHDEHKRASIVVSTRRCLSKPGYSAADIGKKPIWI
jgi:hypothetical protein